MSRIDTSVPANIAINAKIMSKTFFHSRQLNIPNPSYDERKTISTMAGTSSPRLLKNTAPTRLRWKERKQEFNQMFYFAFRTHVGAHLMTGSRSGTAIPTPPIKSIMTVLIAISETFLVFAILFSIFFNRISIGM